MVSNHGLEYSEKVAATSPTSRAECAAAFTLTLTYTYCKLCFVCIIRRLQKEVAVSSHSLSRGLFNVYWLIESKCLGEFSWISLLYRLGVLFTKRLLVRK